nr:MAG TPA: hypothetical protein [Bacteriophage sp.]
MCLSVNLFVIFCLFYTFLFFIAIIITILLHLFKNRLFLNIFSIL